MVLRKHLSEIRISVCILSFLHISVGTHRSRIYASTNAYRTIVFIIKKVLQVVKEAEAATTAKQSRKQPRKRSIQNFSENEEDEMLETESDSSCSDCIVVASSISI